MRLCCLCLGDMAFEYLHGTAVVDDSGNARSPEVQALGKTCAEAVVAVLQAEADDDDAAKVSSRPVCARACRSIGVRVSVCACVHERALHPI